MKNVIVKLILKYHRLDYTDLSTIDEDIIIYQGVKTDCKPVLKTGQPEKKSNPGLPFEP